MKPWLDDGDVRLYCGDALDVLRELPDASVDCCVTSPPYFGLRDYGIDGQLGLESSPKQYEWAMVSVFRQVRRVIADHGTLWLNLGDSYASDAAKGGSGTPNGRNGRGENYARPGLHDYRPKNLMGMPWRVAFALQADGWYLRSDIIWAKPNPMPESVTDRPTKSHEYVFMLTKSSRYFFDQEAVREPHTPDGRKDRTVQGGNGSIQHRDGERWPNAGRNVRSVWNIATQPYPEAHFATFPEELARRCILAGCAMRVCRVCGKPSERIVERQNESAYSRIKREHGITYKDMKAEAEANGITPGNVGGMHAPGQRGAQLDPTQNLTVGWSDCGHNNWRPDDHETIHSPLGERVGHDPSMTTGRAGMNRPRHPDEGRRPMTRYQQRMYADQLRASEHRQTMTDESGGTSTFAHYIRTDRSGARPVPAALLDTWIERGWLERVEPPEVKPHNNWRPGVVLDPFAGSGTTLKVARDHGRHSIGIDLSEEYLELAARRAMKRSKIMLPKDLAPAPDGTLNLLAT